MQARILNPAEEHIWEEFVWNHPLGNIHQTPEWGHFQAKIPGRGRYWIIALTESLKKSSQNNSGFSQAPEIIAGTLLIRHNLPKGYCWLYAPRGPLLNYDFEANNTAAKNNYALAKNQMNILLSEIEQIARQEKAIFFRVDPLIKLSPTAESCTHNVHTENSQKSARLSRYGGGANFLVHFPNFRQNITGFQPDHTLVLDLTKSEQELLAQMKPKGRYNIKLAEKKGITIRQAGPFNSTRFEKDLKTFYQVLTETTSRDNFHGHDLQFYKNMLENLGTHATLYLAEYNNQIIAACLNTFYKDTATYYYGASSNANRHLMAPYLLHWQAIKDAKQKGCKFYDFFGIAPENSKNHPWAGVTKFKKKFGGTEISYQKPQEFPFKKSLYFLYHIYKKLK